MHEGHGARNSQTQQEIIYKLKKRKKKVTRINVVFLAMVYIMETYDDQREMGKCHGDIDLTTRSHGHLGWIKVTFCTLQSAPCGAIDVVDTN